MSKERVGNKWYNLPNLKVNKKWIREHLPEDITDEDIDDLLDFRNYYVDGLKILCNGDRNIFYEEYEAKDEEDLRFWAFKKCCEEIGEAEEMYARGKNARKWRYSMDHVENGRWMYRERKKYQYNAIEDTRLASFETYLALAKNGLPEELWEKEVKDRVHYMNVRFIAPHWDYDRKKLQFVEISDSKEYYSEEFKTVGEPTPAQIIR